MEPALDSRPPLSGARRGQFHFVSPTLAAVFPAYRLAFVVACSGGGAAERRGGGRRLGFFPVSPARG